MGTRVHCERTPRGKKGARVHCQRTARGKKGARVHSERTLAGKMGARVHSERTRVGKERIQSILGTPLQHLSKVNTLYGCGIRLKLLLVYIADIRTLAVMQQKDSDDDKYNS
jgi:hypothetical protein